MGQILDALHQLQAIELKIAAIRRTEAGKTRRVQTYKRQVAAADTQFAEHRKAVRERQLRLDQLNLEVAARDQNIQKQRDALGRAKTNKEYAAILAAINTTKADNSKLESTALELMDDIQSLKSATVHMEEEKTALLARVADAEREAQAYRDEVAAELARLEGEREECATGIGPELLQTFSRLAEHHDGEALAPVQEANRKRTEYICGGCNMTIALEIVNVLKSSEEIRFCHVCGRILYLEEPASRRSS
ncbi:MAG TPA: hypothetical protein PKK06_02075 [Phycisphaerae bacterium]|nr:hypothetical protein [Phycisphaerae bacterium]HNU44087.1 hypothetical protein [Phycisphaerae bacterium]